MLMKLSKRFAAALIALCMLLVSLPASADIVSGPVGTFPNVYIKVELGDTPVPVTGSVVTFSDATYGNGFRIYKDNGVVFTEEFTKTNLDAAGITNTIMKTSDTPFYGIALSGSATLHDSNTYYRDIYKKNGVVEFQFDNLVCDMVRSASGDSIIFFADAESVANSVVPGTAKRLSTAKYEEIKNLTGTDIVLTNDYVDVDDVTAADFSNFAHFGGYQITNLSFKRATESVEMGAFPAGTLFFSANTMGGSLSAGNGNGLVYTGYNTNLFMKGVFVAQADGTYTVFGLRSVYKNNANKDRGAAAFVDGIEFVFDKWGDSEPANGETDWATGGPSWMWDQASGTITLKAGNLFEIEQYKYGSENDRLAAIALVPTSEVDELTAVSGWEYAAANIPSQANLDLAYSITTKPYVKPAEVFADINVNGDVVENVGSDEAETVLAGVASKDFDGAVINDVTIMDALVAAGKITANNATTYKNKLVVKLNGLTICDSYDKWIVTETDEIVVEEPTTIDKTNFAPVNFGAIKDTFGGVTGGVKMVFNKDATKGTQLKFIFDSSDAYIDDVLKGAKLRGFGKYDAEAKDATNTTHGITFPAGTKFYFDISTFDETLKPDDFLHGIKLTGIQQSGSTDYAVFYVTLPNGKYAHHPYLMTPNDIKNIGNFDGVWAVNSETTDKVQARFVNGKFQLYTDGSRAITIVRIKNGSVTMEDAYVSVGEPVHLKLDEGEKAYVWARNHFVSVGTAGTTMKPLTDVLELD